ncbi:MAG: hypothetical protein ABSG63_05525 [Spirochaetia bacterium]|jgi:predicted transcriptional regulator
MNGEPNLEKIAQQLDLNFQLLEDGAELSFNKAARTMIRGHCAFLIWRAKLLRIKPDLLAKKSKRKGLQIAEEAVAAKQSLENLLALVHKDALWVFGEWPPRDWLDRLKGAISVVGEIADAAKLSATRRRKPGRPRLWLFKNFAQNLYAVYRRSGGKKKVSYNTVHKYYYGVPLYFIRAALAQVEALIPAVVKPKILPETDSARTRLIADAIQTYLRRQKTLKKNKEI